jgi:DNA replication protein DnaC
MGRRRADTPGLLRRITEKELLKMDRLSDDSLQETREASCPEHGAYQSRRFMRNAWSKCPACSAAHSERMRQENEARARIEAEQRHRARLGWARIPARFIGRTFDNFHAATDEQRHALTVAREFAEDFAENARRGRGLIFSGLPGTGKSHLAAAILQQHLERDVCYLTCLDMIREIRETWRRDSERGELEVLRHLGGMDLLVLDEIGVQYGTDAEQTLIFEVLDRRYRDVKPSILLTNQDKAGFKQFIGERTFDRLAETHRWVPFDWPSYRPQARKEQTAEQFKAAPTSGPFAGAI